MMHSDKIIETLNRIRINQKIVKNIRDAVSAACEGSKAYKDAQKIADHGAKLDKVEACAFFPELDPDLFTY